MTNSGETRNDIAWSKLFEQYQILERVDRDNQYHITSTQINEFREARLMTKFDEIDHLPSIFRENKLSILPISRGGYVIGRINAYHQLELSDNKSVRHFEFPQNLVSLDYQDITSETSAINCAYISGILEDFLEEEELFFTVAGRMSSGAFEFHIDGSSNSRAASISLDVKNAQVEIDAGFESLNNLSIIEAKNSIPYSFIIRQLFYPYRLWSNKISKPIRTIFLTYANRIFHLYEYKFVNLHHYNSLELQKDQRYSLEPNDIELRNIENILESIQPIEEPECPFPQANSFDRIIDLCEHLHRSNRHGLTHDEITAIYNFDKRQTDYYTNAGVYLGIIDKQSGNTVRFALSDKGQQLFRSTYRERQLGFVASILEHSVFAESLKLFFEKYELPTKNEIVSIMQNSNLRNIDRDSTYERRSQTIRRWLEWIVELQSQ